MKLKKLFRITISANFLLLFVFAFLPILLIKPDFEVIDSVINYINKD